MYAKVYIIKADNFKLKIGFARNPKRRLSVLQIYSAEELELIFQTENLEKYRLVERVAHRILKQYRVKGEWFKVSDEQAKAAVIDAVTIVRENREYDFITKPKYGGTSITLLEEETNILNELKKVIVKKNGKPASNITIVRIAIKTYYDKLIAEKG